MGPSSPHGASTPAQWRRIDSQHHGRQGGVLVSRSAGVFGALDLTFHPDGEVRHPIVAEDEGHVDAKTMAEAHEMAHPAHSMYE